MLKSYKLTNKHSVLEISKFPVGFFTEKASDKITKVEKVYKVLEFQKTKFTIYYSMVKSKYIKDLQNSKVMNPENYFKQKNREGKLNEYKINSQ